MHGPGLAQLAERPTVHWRDAGSNPASGVQDAEGPPRGGPSCNSTGQLSDAIVPLRSVATRRKVSTSLRQVFVNARAGLRLFARG